MELVCPAGNLLSLKAAVDQGADAVYLGFNNETNARSFVGLNFTIDKMHQAVEYAHKKNTKVFLAVNTYPQPHSWKRWQEAIDCAVEMHIDAIIAADISLLDYTANRYPDINLHLSVQSSATSYEALRFYHENFNIRRAVLPRVLSMTQVRQVAENSPIDLEVFGFGSLCIMAEGRCHLSSYITGESPNMCGVCSPAKFVSWEMRGGLLDSRLNNTLINCFHEKENAGYPTLCKGRFRVEDKVMYVLEEPTSLNMLANIPDLCAMNIKAIKIEGRQRSPAYVGLVTDVWRQALDSFQRCASDFKPKAEWMAVLAKLSEGSQTTLGAYQRSWH